MKLVIASAAFSFGLAAASTSQSAAVAYGGPNTTMANSHLTWAVVRVTVSHRSDVEGMRSTYQAGNTSFNRTALQAVSKTTFASTASAKASTFDYLLLTDAHGKRAARILAALPQDAQLSPTATVSVRKTNPWTSGVVACST